MTRRKFLEDVRQAGLVPPEHIKNVAQYEADGLRFVFHCLCNATEIETRLNLITTAVEEYPIGNGFILFTEDAFVDPRIQGMLEDIQRDLDDMTVRSALKRITEVLLCGLTLSTSDTPPASYPGHMLVATEESQSPDTSISAPDGSFDEDDEEYDSDLDDNFRFEQPAPRRIKMTEDTNGSRLNGDHATKLKSDLSTTSKAGFRVGVLGNSEHKFIICLSVRLARLGISDDAMKAWGLFRHQYLVLLIQFEQGYQDLSKVRHFKELAGDVEMRVGICDRYKPHRREAFQFFEVTDSHNSSKLTEKDETQDSEKLKPLFIARPLNQLLRQQFAQMVNFRSWGISWAGAEHCYREVQGNVSVELPVGKFGFEDVSDDNCRRVLPEIVVGDALSEMGHAKAPLPLVAMQFLLRHFVRCSEFCLVCHCKIEDAVEAIKPYVCTNPLCLYQFLALGFGPCIEWEIMAQPQVVDLLISLCYAQAYNQKLNALPLGIGLKVPLLAGKVSLTTPVVRHGIPPRTPLPPSAPPSPPQLSEPFQGIFHSGFDIIESSGSGWPKDLHLCGGAWLAFTSATFEGIYHGRIRNFNEAKIFLSELVKPTPRIQQVSRTGALLTYDVYCHLYEMNFDRLPAHQQYAAIIAMLDSLPSVDYMQQYLEKQRETTREASLNSLSMIPPPARDLLRWIVASNRSCIMQVDKLAGDAEQKYVQAFEPRVRGMNEWMQFRFAQGAPDKEMRFVNSIKRNTVGQKHPTIFAWHGSPLYNWHSIIRSGLNYDETINGRAYGHGVYMSPNLQTSMGYAHPSSSIALDQWPNSVLKVSMVISLQEVINLSAQFVSKSPHLVVSQMDWIQTRYLFVKTSAKHSLGSPPSHSFKQDPQFRLVGADSEEIIIPINAISTTRDLGQTKSSEEYDFNSEDSDEDDLGWTEHECVEVGSYDDCVLLGVRPVHPVAVASPKRPAKRKSAELGYMLDTTKTDFMPGQLDVSNIKFLPSPNDATTAATRTLMKAFTETIKLQETTPLHELGFYIDPERLDNVYQWIIELHSFDVSLPLAADLKAAGLRSIVLEFLFTNDHPYSPPFVRVVKPRFLPFQHGGGGHVTEGGAICMELLTSDGWSVVCTIENVLLQIRLALSETERPARLLSRTPKEQNVCYGIHEALTAYKRACVKHGWTMSKSIDLLMKHV